MTALKGKAIHAFLKRRDESIAAVLIYGPDLGLVRERANALAKQITPDLNDPFNAIELTDADLKGEPSRLADELSALSLMGGERLIRIRTSGEGASAAAKILIEGLEGGYLKPNGVVLIEAGDLAKSSGLRKLFEKTRAGLAIPCYADAPADIRAIAIEAAAAEEMKFDGEALDLMVLLLGEDRGVSRREIEKLILFKGPKAVRAGSGGGPATITVDDVRAVLVDTISDAASEAARAAADGAQISLARALSRLAGAGASPIGSIRMMQREFTRLRAVKTAMAGGASAEAAMARLRPPVFFMEKRAFEARLHRWPLPRIEMALEILLEAELGAKSTGLPDAEIAERAAIRITAMAGR
ncbi:MAG: DNA polymerase III subunit delta [Parvularculaceae bacterium]